MASSGSGQASPPYRPYRHLRILPESAMSCVKFSSDGSLLASASARQDRHPLVRLLPNPPSSPLRPLRRHLQPRLVIRRPHPSHLGRRFPRRRLR
ncbi:hypothetical protein C1H46_028502 [Malus baccata]|uniref:Uncharacterized protein n=1 Tax=Malus baccata TaxID=106549 RepID=A0A540LHK7_MALBA|nr:hypothetical protein C1H46_028502 [Malus baccata]